MHTNAGTRFMFVDVFVLLSLLLPCVLFERSLTVWAATSTSTSVLNNGTLDSYNACPEQCICKNKSETVRLLRVKCGGTAAQRLTTLNDLDFSQDASNIVDLDLSSNGLTHLQEKVFTTFKTLRRLDLSSNELRDLDKNTFDVSFPQVECLKLANNSIAHIFPGAFDQLQHLKFLDISQNPLVCDCDLMWLLAWSSSHGVKLKPPPKCEAPAYFKGTLLKKLHVGRDLHCESPLQPLLELLPKKNQVVFEGDKLVLNCRAPRIAIGVPRDSEDLPPRAHVFWGWSQQLRRLSDNDHLVFQDPTKVLSDVYLETKHTTDSGILHWILRIERLSRNHTGLWDCTLRSPHANLSQTVGIVVIAKNSEYCNATRLHTNKGIYYWPRTLRGETVQQQCAEEVESTQTASYECGLDGNWLNLHTDSCPFISETTRILEQFSKVNLTLTKANAVEIARRLHNFTQMQMSLMRDPMDLEFLARTLLNFLENNRKLQSEQHEISYLLLDVVSLIMKLPFNLFYAAQQQLGSSLKFLKASEWAAAYLQIQYSAKENLDTWPALQSTAKQLFIEYFNIFNNNFAGISCYWQRHNSALYTHSYFRCSEANDTFPLFEQYLDAAIQVPMSLLSNGSSQVEQQRLLLSVYANAQLMPHLQANRSAAQVNELLSSPVLSAQLVNWTNEQVQTNWEEVANMHLPEPVMFILRMRPYHQPLSAPRPAVWNPHTNTWQTEPCHTIYTHSGLLLCACHRLGYYGLLQRTEFLNVYASSENAGAAYRHLPLAIYVGSVLLFLALSVNIVTYYCFAGYLRINRQQRHALLNLWLALALLCATFTLGIFQTPHFELCQLSGLLIHYFSLSVLLWLCVCLSGLYKRLSKQQRFIHMGVAFGGAESVATDHTQLSHKQALQKPILGVYLVGWGIGCLICGISSAVNMREYASYGYCFFEQRNNLNALFVPAGVLMGFLCIMFIFSYYQLKRRIYLSQAQQTQFSDNTEHIDLDWLDQSSNNNNNINRRQTMEQYRSLTFSHAHSSIVDDYERSQLAHLRAYLIVLLLYMLAWWSASATVLEMSLIYEQSMLNAPIQRNNAQSYSIVYALSCALLSLFILIFYTLSRNDTCAIWRGGGGGGGAGGGMAGQSNSLQVRAAQQAKGYNNTSMTRLGVTHLSVAYKAAGGVPTEGGSLYSQQQQSVGSRSNSQCSSHKQQRTSSVRSQERINAEQHLLAASGTIHSAPSPQMFNHMINNQAQQHHQQQQQQRLLVSTQDIPNADLFYNPNQINVARKFFKKQKRLAKRNNFELQRQQHSNYDDTSDISSLTGGSEGRGRYNARNVNALTLLSGGGRKVNNTNIYYAAAQAAAVGLDDKHLLPNMVANIYTNIPETAAPQHEVIKMRGSRLGAATPSKLAADVLSEHDEEEEEEEESSGSLAEHAPLYENTKKKTTPPTTALVMKKSEVAAMNSLGLPEPPAVQEVAEVPAVPLGTNDIYISNSLHITHCVNIDESFPLMTLIRGREQQQQQSKSLNNINDIFNVNNPNTGKGGTKIEGVVVGGVISATVTTLTTSKSSDNISQEQKCAKVQKSEQIKLNNEVIATTTTAAAASSSSSAAAAASAKKFVTQTSSSNATSPNPNSTVEHLYEHSSTPCVLSASPTNESDLNYQNSELSIRSHDVYAPQADNELNLTLTDDFPPYLGSSNTSDGDDENALPELTNDDDHDHDNDNEPNNVLNGHCMSSEFSDVDSILITTVNECDENDELMNTSIDELYEAIKRRPTTTTTTATTYTNANTLIVGANNNNHLLQQQQKTDVQQNNTTTTTTTFATNLNETLEDDSSQSSVISYIDPKVTAGACSSSRSPSS